MPYCRHASPTVGVYRTGSKSAVRSRSSVERPLVRVEQTHERPILCHGRLARVHSRGRARATSSSGDAGRDRQQTVQAERGAVGGREAVVPRPGRAGVAIPAGENGGGGAAAEGGAATPGRPSARARRAGRATPRPGWGPTRGRARGEPRASRGVTRGALSDMALVPGPRDRAPVRPRGRPTRFRGRLSRARSDRPRDAGAHRGRDDGMRASSRGVPPPRGGNEEASARGHRERCASRHSRRPGVHAGDLRGSGLGARGVWCYPPERCLGHVSRETPSMSIQH